MKNVRAKVLKSVVELSIVHMWGATVALTISELIQTIVIIIIKIKSQVAADNAIFKKLNLNANMGLGRWLCG